MVRDQRRRDHLGFFLRPISTRRRMASAPIAKEAQATARDTCQKAGAVGDVTRRLRGRRVSNGYEKHAITARTTSEQNPGANVRSSPRAIPQTATVATAVLNKIIFAIPSGKLMPGSKYPVPAAPVSNWGAEIPSSRISAMAVPIGA